VRSAAAGRAPVAGLDAMAVYRHDQHMFALAGIGGLIDRLDADPMLALSQGSKELFHSDLLAWYLRRFPAVRTALLDAWAGAPGPVADDGDPPVRREWRHLDLVVHVPERQPLVVENKMFSLPDERQLDGSHNVDDISGTHR
jgi:hypothetical protein